MRLPTLLTIFLIAACAISTGARGQIAYKCGNTYSQIPCPGAETVNNADQRTSAQKQQADDNTRRDQLAADKLEKQRLREEAQVRSDQKALEKKNKAAAKAKKDKKKAKAEGSADGSSTTLEPPKHRSKKKESPYFTAHTQPGTSAKAADAPPK